MSKDQHAAARPDTIPVIVLEGARVEVPGGGAESGVEFHGSGLTKITAAIFGSRDAPADRMRDNWQRVAAHLSEILGSPSTPKPTGFQIEEIEVGLAVDAKGSIGIASAGVGASLKLKWRRVKEA